MGRPFLAKVVFNNHKEGLRLFNQPRVINISFEGPTSQAIEDTSRYNNYLTNAHHTWNANFSRRINSISYVRAKRVIYHITTN